MSHLNFLYLFPQIPFAPSLLHGPFRSTLKSKKYSVNTSPSSSPIQFPPGGKPLSDGTELDPCIDTVLHLGKVTSHFPVPEVVSNAYLRSVTVCSPNSSQSQS